MADVTHGSYLAEVRISQAKPAEMSTEQMDYLDRAEEMVKTYEAQGLKPISRVGLS